MKYKFRMWHKNIKHMDYDLSLEFINGSLNNMLDQDSLVFMRSLGRKDKNGKDMWEGDIVKTWDNTGALCFGGKTQVLGSHTFFTNPAYVEVVGNEWENPEMVELR